jgi:hypothetical protein
LIEAVTTSTQEVTNQTEAAQLYEILGDLYLLKESFVAEIGFSQGRLGVPERQGR